MVFLVLNEVVQNVTKMLQRVVGADIAMSFRPAVSLGSINADKAFTLNPRRVNES